jgi:hypothetical protein
MSLAGTYPLLSRTKSPLAPVARSTELFESLEAAWDVSIAVHGQVMHMMLGWSE